MTKTTLTTFALALCCAMGAVHAKTASETGKGNSEPEACKTAKDNAKRALIALTDEVRYSSCNCQKTDSSAWKWVCEVEARTVEK